MHNNRAYHQERMYIEMVAAKHNRGIDRADIGTALTDPYHRLRHRSPRRTACIAEGPISDPKDLGPAIKRGIERVKAGEPALIDVVTQPR